MVPPLLLSRRRLVGAATGAIVLRTGVLQAAAAVTPRQTPGPFYPSPPERLGDVDNDLVRVAGALRQAGGEVLHLVGRILDTAGHPVIGARVEIWQCDVNGRYLSRRDRGVEPDRHFQGFGHTYAGGDGSYRFRTIKPVAYPGRTPHIHVAVRGRGGEELVTQMYVADDTRNQRDPLYMSLAPGERRLVSVDLAARQDGSWLGHFPIVVPWRG